MRPLFAIAPLAAVLVLVGPTPHEANQAWADFKAHFFAPKAAPQAAAESQATTVASRLRR